MKGGRIAIKLHPLFIAYGVFTAVFGGFPIFIIYALTALLHECGHVFCGARMGFCCERISLMPYGAAAVCNTCGISAADEIKFALSGPLVNALLCVFVAGLWWFVPDTYAFTDTIFRANMVMLAVNLVPCHPLDGGRVARCLLLKVIPKKVVNVILKVLTALFSAGAVVVFIFFYRNVSLLALAVFLLSSLFEKDVPACRMDFSAKKRRGGTEICHVLLRSDSRYKDALRCLADGKYHVFVLYDGGEVFEIYEDELCEKLLDHSIYDVIEWG